MGELISIDSPDSPAGKGESLSGVRKEELEDVLQFGQGIASMVAKGALLGNTSHRKHRCLVACLPLTSQSHADL